jgi:hypothetical protein
LQPVIFGYTFDNRKAANRINLKLLIMKMHRKIILGTVLFTSILVSCTKSGSTGANSLKESFNQGAQSINEAINTIASSKAYSVLTVTGSVTKGLSAEAGYNVYITLDTVKGVYNYKPTQKTDRWGQSLIRYFNKSADNSKMIVNMPLSKVTDPRTLREYKASDTLLTNNFSVSVSDYHNNYNSYHDFDYILKSEISIDNAVAGNLNIKYFVSPTLGVDYASQYAFIGGYTADYKYVSGDTTISSFALSSAGKVLYEENRLTIKTDTGRFGREHQYTLTIGDVQIVRKSGTKTVDIYVGGVLQTNAVVTIVDKVVDSEASACKGRDIQITFDDGTTTTISALIGSSIDNIKTLFDSLHSVYFAAYVVDWIAYDIYYQRN